MSVNRREFLLAAAAAPLAAAAAAPVVCIFSKHMAQFDWAQLGAKARELGFDGVDLTVRDKGHVAPERAEQDLPRAIEAIRAGGVTVPMITTGITQAASASARATLRTAARLGVRYWKPGYLHYKLDDVEASIERAAAEARAVAALSREVGVEAGLHNHSGDYVGSAVWDIRYMIRDLPARWIGYYFDPAHATIEGGLAGWRIAQRLASQRLKMVALKDFFWERKNAGWELRWCPMGEGMVNWAEVFRQFAAIRFTGPMTLHIEYEPADELAAIARDLEFTRKQIAAAYR